KVSGKPGEPLHLRAHLVDEVPAHRWVNVLIGHQLEEASEREERRPQLMRGVRDELAACTVELSEAQAHAVEGTCKVSDLVLHRVDDLLLEVTRRAQPRR